MVYAGERREREGAMPVLRSFEFVWDGRRFRLDGKRTQLRAAWSDSDQQVAARGFRERLLAR